MTRLRRQAGTALAVAVAAGALAGIGAPAAMAADDCPNAAVRAQQGAQRLPNCLAYEKVTPANKGGAVPWLQKGILPTAIRADGGSVLLNLNAGIEDAQSFITGVYRSKRGVDGWTTTTAQPAFGDRLPVLQDALEIEAVTPDHERRLYRTRYAFHPNDRNKASQVALPYGSFDLYRQEDDGSLTWVIPDPSVPDTVQSRDMDLVHASPDLERIVLTVARDFDPRVTGSTVKHVYVWSKPHGMQLASVLPGGSVPTDLPVSSGGYSVFQSASEDGRRVAFVTAAAGKRQVFVRYNADDPATAFTREAAVGPNGEECFDEQSASPLGGISPDGRKLVFSCTQPILPGAPAKAVYVRDLDGGPNAVRLVGAGDIRRFIGGNEDFSRVYLEGMSGGEITLVRDGVAEVAVPYALPGAPYTGPYREAHVSSDGEYLLLDSTRGFGQPGVDTGGQNDHQVFRFSAASRELTCISCRPGGAPTDGGASLREGLEGNAGTDLYPGTSITPDGRAAFTSSTALVPEDTNGLRDAYAWIDDRPVLLTSGRGASSAVSYGLAEDGKTFFLVSADTLTPDDRDGRAYDVYAVREGGGWLLPEPTVECTVNCQGPAPERPALPGGGSESFFGSGNLLEAATTSSRTTVSVLGASSVRGTAIKLRVKVSQPGTLRVSGTGLRRVTKTVKKAGTTTVTVRLSAHGSTQQRRRGRLATRVTARLTPKAGAPTQVRKTLTFTQATTKGGR